MEMFISIMSYSGLGFERERARRPCFHRKGLRRGGESSLERFMCRNYSALSLCQSECG